MGWREASVCPCEFPTHLARYPTWPALGWVVGLSLTPFDDPGGLEDAMGPGRSVVSETYRVDARLSVHEGGAVEAQRHKWIESEKAGRDLGEWAIRCWVRQHWNGFLREKWLEHLEGRTFWIELDHDDFGLLQRAYQGSRLIGEIVHRLKSGQENLDVLNWAIDADLPMQEVFEILETLDINSRRIECLLEARLSQAG